MGGFDVPPDHPKKQHIMSTSVATNPTLALLTRKGTGFYKVPTLLGLWYRGPFEHYSGDWLRGGFPRSFLARSDADSLQWRRDFVRTFLERDLAGLGFGMAPAALGRFWTMLSHYHGQIWNGSEVAASLGIAPNTARSHLDALEQTYMVRRLQPWHANLGKRLVKSPKIHFRDSGLFHTLQGIGTAAELYTHPKLGASWEGFALEEALHAVQPEQAYFCAVHSGAELDLFMVTGGRRVGMEFKREDAPRFTHSMQVAMADLKLDRLSVIYPGTRRYRLAEGGGPAAARRHRRGENRGMKGSAITPRAHAFVGGFGIVLPATHTRFSLLVRHSARRATIGSAFVAHRLLGLDCRKAQRRSIVGVASSE